MKQTPAETELEGVDLAGPSEARPVVFLHGATLTRKFWTPQRKALSDAFRVVVPDLPGHGARAGETFRMETTLELLEDVVETYADGRASLVGLSLGGYVATAFAHRHPESVDALVLSGSSLNPVGLLAPLGRVVSTASRLVTKSRLVNRTVERIIHRWVRSRDLPPAVEAEIIDSGIYPSQFGDVAFELAGRDFREAFASYSGPALVLNGKGDHPNRPGETDHANAAPNASVEVLDGAGHICNLDCPDAYNDAIRQFLRSIE